MQELGCYRLWDSGIFASQKSHPFQFGLRLGPVSINELGTLSSLSLFPFRFFVAFAGSKVSRQSMTLLLFYWVESSFCSRGISLELDLSAPNHHRLVSPYLIYSVVE